MRRRIKPDQSLIPVGLEPIICDMQQGNDERYRRPIQSVGAGAINIDGGTVRFVGGRARKVVCLALVPLVALMLILGASVIATTPSIWLLALGTLILPSLVAGGGILIRDLVALDLTIRSEVLTYRTTFRTMNLARSTIDSCSTEEVPAAYGAARAIRPYLLLHDGGKLPLRIFTSFKPDPEVDPNPRWFREMNELVRALQRWLEGVQHDGPRG
jgi:hypothetical protein